MAEQRIHGYCALCISRCGCISVVEDGILKAVHPDPDHPTGSALCVKGKAAPQLVHSPRRLLHPLKRTGPKGADDPGWVQSGWDEALDATAAALRDIAARHGPEAVAFAVTTPSGTAVSDAFVWISRLARAFGSPNLLFNTENCNWHKDFSPALTFGSGIGMPDYERTGCIVYWGFNPSTSWLAQAIEAKAATRRGAALVAVDPRRAGLANSADEWLRPRPGSDGILALALANVLIERDWFDPGFLENYSNGPFLVREDNGRVLTEADVQRGGSPARFAIRDRAGGTLRWVESRAAEHASLSGRLRVETQSGALDCRTAFDLYAERCRAYPPQRAAALTGVPPDQIVATARLLHRRRPVSFFTWTGTAQHQDATQVTRAINLLYALIGDLDAPGGNVLFTRPAIADLSGFDLLADSQRAKCLGFAQRPLGPGARGWINPRDLWRAVVDHDPYPVRALVSFGGNPLLTGASDPRARAALEKLEFHVHADLFHNPTSDFADIVLPVASPWERTGLYPGFQISQAAESLVQLRRPAVAPRGESRSDQAIVFDLARRLGLAGHFFGGNAETALEHQLAGTGLTPEQLRANPGGISLGLQTQYRKFATRGFATPSGRLEIYSQQMLEHGYAPLPEFETCRCEADDENYPLLLTCAKWVQYCHSQHHGLPALRALMPEPVAEIHPRTAAAHGIDANNWMLVRTRSGRMKARARFNNTLDPAVVCAQYGWWEGCADLGLPGYDIEGAGNASYNSCIDGGVFDPVSSSNSLRCWPCDVERYKS